MRTAREIRTIAHEGDWNWENEEKRGNGHGEQNKSSPLSQSWFSEFFMNSFRFSTRVCLNTQLGRHPWNSCDADSEWISPSGPWFVRDKHFGDEWEASGVSDLVPISCERGGKGEKRSTHEHPEISYGPRESCYTGISSLHRDNLCETFVYRYLLFGET